MLTEVELAEYDAIFGMEEWEANEGWGDRFLIPGQELLAEVRRLRECLLTWAGVLDDGTERRDWYARGMREDVYGAPPPPPREAGG